MKKWLEDSSLTSGACFYYIKSVVAIGGICNDLQFHRCDLVLLRLLAFVIHLNGSGTGLPEVSLYVHRPKIIG